MRSIAGAVAHGFDHRRGHRHGFVQRFQTRQESLPVEGLAGGQQKVYSAIHILGLAVGFAASTLIALYITDELSYDGFHKDASKIYRASIFVRLTGVDNPYAVSGFGTAETLKKEIPGIESTLRIISRPNTPLQLDTRSFSMTKLIYADSNFFDFFDFRLLWERSLAVKRKYSHPKRQSLPALLLGAHPSPFKALKRR
jgi:hypothetical protein